ncbi:trafficking protein particle complex subunit 2-like protein [Tribolium castaneum]|uniref:Trafficking protein particle complex subunit 2-like protein n=2 Tax=Tribolium castaneum TaxID=7070 RepID=A0A139WFC7_TRICA|nr:PREDICTED: trafficking protein particle complex subunit 2-like protein [Tribolium castaneum]KYB26632.1 Trafficking protein particle complex subunit 2-like protein [Tribolium castaneum]|eukprot:XP_008195389.1 PREDICTED: trafficking protein particle complex subunit 2-like protein [Tribolium castaneum]
MAVCVAIVGKDNSPKYFCCLNPDEELSFQYKVLSSLDVIEEKLNAGNKGTNDLRELYLGMLYSLETHKIYGYVTNTKIKFVIVVDSTNMALRDNEIRSMFRKLHSEYADIVCNPFYIPGESICSKSFDVSVKNIMTGTV